MPGTKIAASTVMTPIRIIRFSGIFCLLLMSLAAYSATKGPHGGTVIVTQNSSDNTRDKNDARTEISVNRASGRVDVFSLNRESAQLGPPSVNIIGENQSKVAVDLKATDPNAPLPHYVGNFNLSGAPMVGIQIGFRKGNPVEIPAG